MKQFLQNHFAPDVNNKSKRLLILFVTFLVYVFSVLFITQTANAQTSDTAVQRVQHVDRIDYVTTGGDNVPIVAEWDQRPTEGNLLIAMSGHRISENTPTMNSAGWTLIENVPQQSSDNQERRALAIWYKIATDDEPDEVSITWSGATTNNRYGFVTLQEYTGFLDVEFSSFVSTAPAGDQQFLQFPTTTIPDSENVLAVALNLGRGLFEGPSYSDVDLEGITNLQLIESEQPAPTTGSFTANIGAVTGFLATREGQIPWSTRLDWDYVRINKNDTDDGGTRGIRLSGMLVLFTYTPPGIPVLEADVSVASEVEGVFEP